jgi:hypothetical protein
MIVINAGWAITWMWAGISIFIPKHVVDKFTFIGYEEEEIKNTLLNIIDDDQLIIYNGKEYPYNQERELKKELEIFGE